MLNKPIKKHHHKTVEFADSMEIKTNGSVARDEILEIVTNKSDDEPAGPVSGGKLTEYDSNLLGDNDAYNMASGDSKHPIKSLASKNLNINLKLRTKP